MEQGVVFGKLIKFHSQKLRLEVETDYKLSSIVKTFDVYLCNKWASVLHGTNFKYSAVCCW